MGRAETGQKEVRRVSEAYFFHGSSTNDVLHTTVAYHSMRRVPAVYPDYNTKQTVETTHVILQANDPPL